jgi:hypothetical protein
LAEPGGIALQFRRPLFRRGGFGRLPRQQRRILCDDDALLRSRDRGFRLLDGSDMAEMSKRFQEEDGELYVPAE